MATGLQTAHSKLFQDAMKNGFQSFVPQYPTAPFAPFLTATTTTGTPASGTFYSSITNRAAIPDITQDLKVSFGIERIMTQSIVQLQTEFGPNGEPVWAAVNDDRGLVRLVGAAFPSVDSYGPRGLRITDNTSYIEITFYGTGLNVLTLSDGGARTYQYAVDGGTLTTYQSNTVSGILGNRNYSSNLVFPVTSSLPLGVHTVKLLNSTGASLELYGFEIINAASTTALTVNPGSAYIDGLKTSLPAAAAPAFKPSALTTTTGARVVNYLNTDGTIGQVFTAVPASPSYLTNASHANEEMVRSYNFREFGAGRSDDFSGQATYTTNNFAFTLDDGTTTLAGNQVVASNFGGTNVPCMVLVTNSASFLTLSFVGTGLDVLWVNDSATGTNNTANAFTVSVDGGAAQNFPTTGTSGVKTWVKIASGLPYGTHTVKFFRNVPNVWSLGLAAFSVYQPKKPSLPSGAIELSDYNVMATFAANTVQGSTTVSTGVLRKAMSREVIYVEGSGGTSSWSPGLDPNMVTAIQFGSDRASAYTQYSFFGSGFDLRFASASNRSSNIQVSLAVGSGAQQNLTTGNFPSMVSSFYGGSNFSSSTGILSQNNASVLYGSGLVVSGLPLALYTVRFTNNTASSYLVADTIDIITPIHSAKSNLYADLQNTLPVGSQAISDNRQLSPIKDALPAKKAWAQAVGVTSSPTTSSASFVPMPDMSVTIKTSGGPLLISYSADVSNTTVGNQSFINIFVDGVQAGTRRGSNEGTANDTMNISDILIVPVSAGVHKVDLYWSTQGTMSAAGVERTLVVQEK